MTTNADAQAMTVKVAAARTRQDAPVGGPPGRVLVDAELPAEVFLEAAALVVICSVSGALSISTSNGF